MPSVREQRSALVKRGQSVTPDQAAELRALRDNTRRLGELEELARVGSWEWDVVADVVTWSDQLYRIFGVNPDDFDATYEDYLSRLHPDDRPLAERNVERALKSQEPYAADHRVVWPDGEIRWLHCRGRAVAADDGTVIRLMGSSQDITERKQLEERLTHQALHDTLTGLPNRLLLLDRLGHAMRRNSRSKHHTAVLFVDLDRFKTVNDGAGHAAGDQVLKVLAHRFGACVRRHDTVARYGGDEFVVVAEDLHWPDAAVNVADRILEAVSRPIPHPTGAISVTASVGGTVAADGRTPEEVLRNADTAMYDAKQRGGHTIAWHDPDTRRG